MKINTLSKRVKRVVISLMTAALIATNMMGATSITSRAYEDGDEIAFDSEQEYDDAVAAIPGAPEGATSDTTVSEDGTTTTSTYEWTDEDGATHTLTVESKSVDLEDTVTEEEITPESSETTEYDPWVLDHVEEDGTKVYLTSETETTEAEIKVTTNENKSESTTVTETIVTKDVEITKEEADELGEGNYRSESYTVDVEDEETALALKELGIDVKTKDGDTTKYEVSVQDLLDSKDKIEGLKVDTEKGLLGIDADTAKKLQDKGYEVKVTEIPGEPTKYSVSIDDVINSKVKEEDSTLKVDTEKGMVTISKDQADALKKLGYPVEEKQVKSGTTEYTVSLESIIAEKKSNDGTLKVDENAKTVIISKDQADALKALGYEVTTSSVKSGTEEYTVSLESIIADEKANDGSLKVDENAKAVIITKAQAEALNALGYKVEKTVVKSGTEKYTVSIESIIAGGKKNDGSLTVNAEAGTISITKAQADALKKLGYEVKSDKVKTGTEEYSVTLEDILANNIRKDDTLKVDETKNRITVNAEQAQKLIALGYPVEKSSVKTGTEEYTVSVEDILNKSISNNDGKLVLDTNSEKVKLTEAQAEAFRALGYAVEEKQVVTGTKTNYITVADLLKDTDLTPQKLLDDGYAVDANAGWISINKEQYEELKNRGFNSIKAVDGEYYYVSESEAKARGDYEVEHTEHKGIYENDANLADIKMILGDYGIVAEEVQLRNHTETNVNTDKLDIQGSGAIGTTQNLVYNYNENGVDAVVSNGHVSLVQGVDSNVQTIMFAQDNGAVLETDIQGAEAGHKDGNANQLTVKIDNNGDGNNEQEIYAQNASSVQISNVDLPSAKETLNLVEDLANKMMTETADVSTQNVNGKTVIDATKDTENANGYDIVYAKVTVDENGRAQGLCESEGLKVIMRDDQVIVINVEAGNADSISLYKFGIQVGDKTTTTDRFDSDMNKLSQQIVLNFGSYAGKIELAGSVAGTIIAPNAEVVINGTSTGQLAATKVSNGSGEWHYTGNSAGYGEDKYKVKDTEYSAQGYSAKEDITGTEYYAQGYKGEKDTYGDQYTVGQYKGEKDTYTDKYSSVQYQGERDTYADQYSSVQYKGEKDTYADQYSSVQYKGEKDTYKTEYSSQQYYGEKENKTYEYETQQYYNEETETLYYYDAQKYYTDKTEVMTYTLTWQSEDSFEITGGKKTVEYAKETITPTPSITTTPTPTPNDTPTPTPGDNPTPTPSITTTPTPTPDGEVLGERRLPEVTPTSTTPQPEVLGVRRPIPHTADAAQMNVWVSLLCGGVAGIATWAGLKKKDEEEA